MKKYPLVSIIIVNYNGKKFLKECFESLFNSEYPKSKLEVIMVDNCSTDDSISMVKKYFPKVKIIENNENNYCKANNLGIKNSQGEYVGFINNDVEVNKDWLIELIKALTGRKQIAGGMGKVLFKNGLIQSTGHYELPDFYWSDKGLREKDKGQFDKTEILKTVPNIACLYKKEIFDIVGMFDEDFGMYLEDLDLGIRCRKYNLSFLYVPTAFCYHSFHGTAKEEFIISRTERNRLFIIAKHYSEKLPDSLFGKGFFSLKMNELLDFFPLIFNKLVNYSSVNLTLQLLPPLFENLNKLSIHDLDYLRNKNFTQQDKIKELKRKLKDKEIKENDFNISDSRRAIQELNERLKDIDKVQQEREKLFFSLNSKIVELNNVVAEKDSQVEIKDFVIQERDEALKELNDLIKENNGVVHERDRVIQERDRKISEINVLIREKDNLIRESGFILQKKNKKIQELDEKLQALRNELAETYKRLKEQSFVIGEKDRKIQELDYTFQKIERNVIKKTGKLEELRQLLDKTDKKLEFKNQQIVDLNILIEQKTQTILNRDTLLKHKTKNIEELSVKLKNTEQELGRWLDWVDRFWHSKTYRYFLRYIWGLLDIIKKLFRFFSKIFFYIRCFIKYILFCFCLIFKNFIRGLKKIFNIIFFLKDNFMIKEPDISIAYFKADSYEVNQEEGAVYILKLTNNTYIYKKIKILFEICSLDQKKRFGYVIKTLCLAPQNSLISKIKFDWNNNFKFFLNGKSFFPDEGKFIKDFSPRIYALSANLYTKNNKLKESTIIYQTLKR